MIIPALSPVAKHPAAGPGLYPVRSEQGVITSIVTSTNETEQGVFSTVVTSLQLTREGVITEITSGVTDVFLRIINQDIKTDAQGNPITHEHLTL